MQKPHKRERDLAIKTLKMTKFVKKNRAFVDIWMWGGRNLDKNRGKKVRTREKNEGRKGFVKFFKKKKGKKVGVSSVGGKAHGARVS